MLKSAPHRTTSDAAQMGTDAHGLVKRLNHCEKLPRLHQIFAHGLINMSNGLTHDKRNTCS
jgi:hypothetical protein